MMYGSSDIASKPGESWFEEKDKLGLDFPNLPYLIDGDFKLTESEAIMKYICMKYNPKLLGKTQEDKGRILMVESVLRDLKKLAYSPAYKKNGTVDDFLPAKTTVFNLMEYIHKNNYEFLGGSEVAFVDFYLFEIVSWLNGTVFNDSMVKEHIQLNGYMSRMKNLPGFAQVWQDDTKCIKGPFNGNMAWIGNAN